MIWTQRLGTLGETFDLGGAGRAHILSWNYEPALLDNAPHRHTFFEVCYVGARGGGEFRVEGTSHPIQSGDTFFARPGMVHQIVNTELPLMELFWVCFSLESQGASAGDFISSATLVAHDARVGAIWNALRLSAQNLAPGWSETARALALALLHALLGAGTPGIAGETIAGETVVAAPDFRAAQARAAVRYINDNLAKKMTLPEIAAHIHVSPRQLVRLFSLFVGTSPAHFIERARLDRAESLLRRSNKSLKEVAREVGFEDAAHFSRVFARRNGNPPGDFRQRGHALIERASGANIQNFGELV